MATSTASSSSTPRTRRRPSASTPSPSAWAGGARVLWGARAGWTDVPISSFPVPQAGTGSRGHLHRGARRGAGQAGAAAGGAGPGGPGHPALHQGCTRPPQPHEPRQSALRGSTSTGLALGSLSPWSQGQGGHAALQCHCMCPYKSPHPHFWGSGILKPPINPLDLHCPCAVKLFTGIRTPSPLPGGPSPRQHTQDRASSGSQLSHFP